MFRSFFLAFYLVLGLSFGLGLSTQAWGQSSDYDNSEGGGPLLGDWRVSFFSISSLGNMRPGMTADGERSLDSYVYFSFNKSIASDQRFSVRIPFANNTAGFDAYGEEVPWMTNLQNVHFVWTDYDWGYLGDVDFQGKVKIYLPTSEYSQASKMVAQLRVEFIADYTVAPKWQFHYEFVPDIYWQTQTASLNEDVPLRYDGSYAWDPRQTTQQYGLNQKFRLSYDVTPRFGVDGGFEIDEGWYYSSTAENLNGRHSTTCTPNMGIKLSLDRYFFRFGVGNTTRLEGYRGKDVQFFLPENTEYSLMFTGSLF